MKFNKMTLKLAEHCYCCWPELWQTLCVCVGGGGRWVGRCFGLNCRKRALSVIVFCLRGERGRETESEKRVASQSSESDILS